MLRRRIALAGTVLVVASLGAAPAAWAKNSGTPKPVLSGNPDGTVVCHAYPGAIVNNKNGVHGTPGAPSDQCLLPEAPAP